MTGARSDHLLAGLARDPEIFPHRFDLAFHADGHAAEMNDQSAAVIGFGIGAWSA